MIHFLFLNNNEKAVKLFKQHLLNMSSTIGPYLSYFSFMPVSLLFTCHFKFSVLYHVSVSSGWLSTGQSSSAGILCHRPLRLRKHSQGLRLQTAVQVPRLLLPNGEWIYFWEVFIVHTHICQSFSQTWTQGNIRKIRSEHFLKFAFHKNMGKSRDICIIPVLCPSMLETSSHINISLLFSHMGSLGNFPDSLLTGIISRKNVRSNWLRHLRSSIQPKQDISDKIVQSSVHVWKQLLPFCCIRGVRGLMRHLSLPTGGWRSSGAPRSPPAALASWTTRSLTFTESTRFHTLVSFGVASALPPPPPPPSWTLCFSCLHTV